MTVLPPESEKDLQDKIIKLARLLGWRVYHTYDSRRSAHGFPDLVLVRRGRLIFAELKTDKGRITRDQQVWLNDLVATAAEPYVWRPRDWDQIVETLKGAA